MSNLFYMLFNFDDTGIVSTLIFIVALTATILMFLFVLPEGKRHSLNDFFEFIHNLFNFKYLVVEKILQFFYIFATFVIMLDGLVIMLDSDNWGDFWQGILTTILGPIIIRIVFEFAMMLILAVRNIIQINEKLGKILKNNNQSPLNQQQSAPKQQNTYQQQSTYQQTNTYQEPNTNQKQSTNPHQTINQHPNYDSFFCSECGGLLYSNGSCSNSSCSKHSNCK